MPRPKYPARKTTAKSAQTSAAVSTEAGYSPTQGTTQAFTAALQQPVYDYAATQGAAQASTAAPQKPVYGAYAAPQGAAQAVMATAPAQYSYPPPVRKPTIAYVYGPAPPAVPPDERPVAKDFYDFWALQIEALAGIGKTQPLLISVVDPKETERYPDAAAQKRARGRGRRGKRR